MAPHREIETPVPRAAATMALDLASLWADLLLVEMSLHERSGIAHSGATIYLRRALWEQAVIAYGRCFKTGSRGQLPTELRDSMTAEELEVHRETLLWRDKHVAHRVEKRYEWTQASLAYRPDSANAHAVRIRVELNEGPDDDLNVRLIALARRLRLDLWSGHFASLESSLVASLGSDATLRSRAAPFAATSKTFYTINPTG